MCDLAVRFWLCFQSRHEGRQQLQVRGFREAQALHIASYCLSVTCEAEHHAAPQPQTAVQAQHIVRFEVRPARLHLYDLLHGERHVAWVH